MQQNDGLPDRLGGLLGLYEKAEELRPLVQAGWQPLSTKVPTRHALSAAQPQQAAACVG